MQLVDVNVLVYAFRRDARDHPRYAAWLNQLVNSEQAFGVSDQVLSGFLRIVTHPRIFSPPTPLSAALAFTEAFRSAPAAVPIMPGARHWDLFVRLCRDAGARGNLIADAWFAALAIESGSEFITTDRDYARFRGLKWSHPLEE
jgi:toxin-antitoxin system PIN domain toxin